MKRITASLLVLVLMFSASPASPAAAYNWPGNYWHWSVIGDGDLNVCFEDNTTPTWTNRAVILAGMNLWAEALALAFDDVSNAFGECTGTLTDIEVTWVSLGDCTDGDPLAVTVGPQSPGSINQNLFQVNSDCGESHFYWGASVPIPDNKVDIYELAAHEAGHILGLGHVDDGLGTVYTEFSFDNLCSGTYKWDVSCTYPTSPKNTAGKIYSGSLDPGVGNYSNSPRPSLAINTYRITYTIANESLTRNPGGVRIEIYQGTTLKHTGPYTTGLATETNTTNQLWTTTADLRFKVPFSKAAIYDVKVTKWTAGTNLMEPLTPHCPDPTDRITILSADDAAGAQAIYPSLSLGGTFDTDITCVS